MGHIVLGYVWLIPVSQVGKLVNSSTGIAELTFTDPYAETFSRTLPYIALPTLTGPETEQLYEESYL